MTSSSQYQTDLIDAYNGERMGIVLGRELASHTEDAQERAVYLAFAQVETVARAQLEPMITAAALGDQTLSEQATEQQGIDLARDMAKQPRAAAWTGILPEFEKFIGLLKRLRELAPADDLRPYDVLVEHEHASVAMVKAIIDNDLDHAQSVLQNFLSTASDTA